jgi:hypothetical protein
VLPGSGGSSRARPAACARERDERTAVPTPRWFESARSCPAAAALPTCPGPVLHRTVPQSVHGRTRQERVSFMHALPRGTTHPEPSSTHLKGRVRERLLHGLEVIAVCRETRETQSQRQHAWRHLTYVRCRIRTVNGAQRSVDEQPDRCKDGQIADARVAFAARHLQGKMRRHVVRNSSQLKSSKARQVKSGSSRSPRANHTTVPQRTAPHLWSMGSIKVVVEQQLNRKSPSPSLDVGGVCLALGLGEDIVTRSRNLLPKASHHCVRTFKTCMCSLLLRVRALPHFHGSKTGRPSRREPMIFITRHPPRPLPGATFVST